MAKHNIKILRSEHFSTLCIKGIRALNSKKIRICLLWFCLILSSLLRERYRFTNASLAFWWLCL